MIKNSDFIHYYFLENYLFFTVNEKFVKNHRLDAFDFFSIITWYESKNVNKIINKIIVLAKKYNDIPRSYQTNIDYIIKKITRDLYQIKDEKEKFELLHIKWKIPYNLAFAVLAVLFPDTFVLFNEKIANEILKSKISINNDNIWNLYIKYMNTINKRVPMNISLNDKVRYLLGKEFVHDLNEVIFKNN